MSELTDYYAALIAACSALAIVLGLLAAREFDWKLRRLEIRRRRQRRKGMWPSYPTSDPRVRISGRPPSKKIMRHAEQLAKERNWKDIQP